MRGGLGTLGWTAAAGVAAALVLAAVPAFATASVDPAAPAGGACLPDGSGYLRARLSDALTANLDWHGAELECEGGMRPDGRGLRVSFAGPLRARGMTHRLRFIFGVETGGEGRSGRALPANVTLILEGERRIFSTRGDDKCTVDALRQEPVGRAPHRRDYRVEAHGFCVGPATSLTSPARVLVSRFDFVGRISLYIEAPAAPSGPRAPGAPRAAPRVPPGAAPGAPPGAAPRTTPVAVRAQERTAESNSTTSRSRRPPS